MNIKIIYSTKHAGHNPPYEIYNGVLEPYAEKAERIESVVRTLRDNGIRCFQKPDNFPLKFIKKIHQKEYITFLQRSSSQLKDGQVLYPSYFIMDTYTPITNKTYEVARSAVDTALTGAKYVFNGERVVYSLCRPPGHHAGYKAMGGYCYFNNAAIAAHYLSEHGSVALLDIDFHHGNGTQSIFYNRSDVLYVSIHADPHVKFPYSSGFEDERGAGEGLGFNKNYPLPLGTRDARYSTVLLKVLGDIRDFNPDFLVVSAGFDTYEKDPIGGFKLTIPFYKTIGREIAKLRLPTLIIQEGGYAANALGKMVYTFLGGLDR